MLNRLINDILDWIRRFLMSNKGSVKPPYKAVRSYTIPNRGVLKLVEGRDTLRSVRTWVFSPAVNQARQQMKLKRPLDWHIYLDYLQYVPIRESVAYRSLGNNKTIRIPSRTVKPASRATHTVTILRASHHPDKEGNYNVSLVCSKDFDCYQNSMVEKEAIVLCDLIAKLIAYRYLEGRNMSNELQAIYHLVHRLPIPDDSFIKKTEAYHFYAHKFLPKKTQEDN
jgi:hypothetical protein